jgi:hypothetical protein
MRQLAHERNRSKEKMPIKINIMKNSAPRTSKRFLSLIDALASMICARLATVLAITTPTS